MPAAVAVQPDSPLVDPPALAPSRAAHTLEDLADALDRLGVPRHDGTVIAAVRALRAAGYAAGTDRVRAVVERRRQLPELEHADPTVGAPDVVPARDDVRLPDLPPLPGWQQSAACARTLDAAFVADRPEDAAPAYATCGRCTVARDCYAWGVQTKGYGVYGGVWLHRGRTRDAQLAEQQAYRGHTGPRVHRGITARIR